MDRRYQVFVSSTYADLRDERAKVIQALMEMDCIPAGMELFPAMDEEQLEFIKKIIDDSDYYLLIIGGRYGSVDAEGISYTEREYEYAREKGLKVIALVHENIESIPLGKVDCEPGTAEKLRAFKAKVTSGRLVRFWSRSDQLPGLVALSLQKTIKTYPATGWVRGSTFQSEDVLEQIARLERENRKLKESKFKGGGSIQIDHNNLSKEDDVFEIVIRVNGESRKFQITWNILLSIIGPYAWFGTEDRVVSNCIISYYAMKGVKLNTASVALTSIQTIKIQFVALGFLDPEELAKAGVWRLTDAGIQKMVAAMAVRHAASAEEASTSQ